jgi:uncharacterized protein (DUF885 family)
MKSTALRPLALSMSVAAMIVASAPASASTGQKTAPTPAANPTVMALNQLFDREWQRGLRESPESATDFGDHRYDDRWSDLSMPQIERSHKEDVEALKQLTAIPRQKLPAGEQLSYDLFKLQTEDSIKSYGFHEYLMPVNHIYGIQSSQNILQVMSFDSAKDYENWIKRLNAFGALMDQTIALMREGTKEGYVPPRAIMDKVPEQITKQIVDKAEDSPFYTPFKQFPAGMTDEQRTALTQAGVSAINTGVVPAFKRFQTFFNSEYLPASRSTVGVSALPDGAAYYAWLAEHHTTTKLTPDEIHEIGLREVKRIHGEMETIIQQVGFKGSFDDFSKFLRTDPQFYYTNGDDLLKGYAAICKQIDGELPSLFGKLPRMPYGIRPIPMETAPYQTTAYYQPGSIEAHRAGFYYANLYKPETRPKWEMETLTAHEAVPGHHLQLALAQELPDAPNFRRYGNGYTAFHEGWGLYAESLGEQVGLYKDPYSKYGQLSFEMWRAVRLVIDTGLHSKGWTRDQAIEYFAQNTPRARHDIEVEVDRYIAWPGQALAYKIGQLKITELREKAKAALGDKFDIRAFHDVVLSEGDIPLGILEQNVDAWIAQQKKTG